MSLFERMIHFSGFLFGITKWDRFWLGYPEKLGLPERELANSERRIGTAANVADFEEKLNSMPDETFSPQKE